ncbi:MAG: hypothetical protein JJU20_09965 [Opitutales bacterium]|nr:hypothetical protein [Opitutales bacterium]
MNKRDLNTLLNEIREEALPTCPPYLRSRTLARLRAEKESSLNPSIALWDDLLNLALRPQIAVLLLILTVALGTVTTTVASQMVQPIAKPTNPLGFEVIVNPGTLECHHNILKSRSR